MADRIYNIFFGIESHLILDLFTVLDVGFFVINRIWLLLFFFPAINSCDMFYSFKILFFFM